MDFENSTQTRLSLEQRDIREVDRGLVVIGRCPELATHFSELAGAPFARPSWLYGLPGEFVQDKKKELSVLRIPYRPRGQTTNESREIRRCQDALEMPLVFAMENLRPVTIAMVPLSCRRPAVVAKGMVRALWDISVAGFLSSAMLTSSQIPRRVTIYCTGDIRALENELSRGHYPSLRNGQLIRADIQYDEGKRLRYFRRDKFRFRLVADDVSHPPEAASKPLSKGNSSPPAC